MAVVALLLLAGLAVAGAILLRLRTDRGELVLEGSDAEIEVTVKQAGRDPVVIVLDKNGKRSLELTAGDGEIAARELPDGLRFKTQRFQLERGGKPVFTAEMLLARAADRPADPGKNPAVVLTMLKAAAREKPFVLVRKGTETDSFKTFAGAWEPYQPGDEIHIHGDGPFVLGQVDVREKALVLKAAAGFHPVFRPDWESFGKHGAWFTLKEGALTLEGCDFLMRGIPPGDQVRTLIGGGSGPCILRGCRLIGFSSEPLVRDFSCTSLTVEDCLLQLGIYGLGYLPGRCEMTLTNNAITCGWLVTGFGDPGGQKLHLTKNAIVSWSTLTQEGRDDLSRFTVMATGNLFDFSRNLPMKQKEGIKERLHWEGKGNVFRLDKGGLAEWNAQLVQPEMDSQEVAALPFGWRTEIPAQAEKGLPWWQTHLEAARKESGLKDLGPDISLVGPGEAYLRGLANEGRAVLADQLRPEPLTSGRIALLRGGKAIRGTHQLGGCLPGSPGWRHHRDSHGCSSPWCALPGGSRLPDRAGRAGISPRAQSGHRR